jgi:hypothetical protein
MHSRVATAAALTITVLLAFGEATAASAPAATSAAELNGLYWQGHTALGAGEWKLALERFTDLEQQLRKNEPDAADAPIYWQAYALARAGRTAEASAAVMRLQTEFPKSRWIGDARTLLQGGGAAASLAGPIPEDEAGLEALLSQPASQAIDKLVAILRGEHPQQLKKRALFVLSQIDDPGALIQMTAAARGRDPAIRAEAMRLLNLSGVSEEANTTRSVAAVNSMHVAGADEAIARVARDAKAGLGERRAAVQALGQAKSYGVLAEVAASDTEMSIRREAIRVLGEAGGYRRLLQLYPATVTTPVLRDEVLRSLSVAGDAQALVELQRQAKTPEEKEAIARVLARTKSVR